MRELSIDQLSAVTGGAPSYGIIVTILTGLYELAKDSHYAADNGGPDPIYVYGA